MMMRAVDRTERARESSDAVARAAARNRAVRAATPGRGVIRPVETHEDPATGERRARSATCQRAKQKRYSPRDLDLAMICAG